MSTDNERCCGSGTCIIDEQGHCWCGQQWDGTKMAHPSLVVEFAPNQEKAKPDNALDANNP